MWSLTLLTKPMQRAWEDAGVLPLQLVPGACPWFLPALCLPPPPSHLLEDLAALGLSFVRQPSSSPGPGPHPSEREGSPALAWYLMPTCIPLLSPGPFYAPSPRKAQGLNWTSALGQKPALLPIACPGTCRLLLGVLGLGSVEASRLKSWTEASGSSGPDTSFQIKARDPERRCVPG